jgi:hypothetical protein
MVQPETRIQRAIQKMVKERGGFVFKVHGSETMMAGLPDHVIVYRGVPVYFEVKTPTGQLSDRQRYVMRQLVKAGAVVGVPRSVADASAMLDEVDAAVEHREAILRRHSDITYDLGQTTWGADNNPPRMNLH